MKGGISTTLETLAATNNEAATTALIIALDSSHRAIAEGALRTLIQRRSVPGERELVRRWDTLNEHWKDIIARRPDNLIGGLREAILSSDKKLYANACNAIVYMGVHEIMPVLVTAVEDESNALADLAGDAIVRLCRQLYTDLTGPVDPRTRREQNNTRRHVVGNLEKSMLRFHRHRRAEVLEGFLLLTSRDNATLKKQLQNPAEASYPAIIEMLTASPRAGIIRLLLNFLDDPRLPLSVLHILTRRSDNIFITQLLKKVGGETNSRMRNNLKKMETFRWLRETPELVEQFDEENQTRLVKLLSLSGLNKLLVFGQLKRLLLHGKTGARRAAAEAIAEYGGLEANDLVTRALDDEDPIVQAHLLAQLRERGITGALGRLIDGIDSEHEEIREVCRNALEEFNIQRFLSAFDLLEEDVRQSTGEMVQKVDSGVAEALKAEIQSPSRSRKIRGLQAAAYLGASLELEDDFAALMDDEDHFVRNAVAEALSYCDTESARQSLRQLLLDSSVVVQQSAEAGLQQFAAQPETPEPPAAVEETETIS